MPPDFFAGTAHASHNVGQWPQGSLESGNEPGLHPPLKFTLIPTAQGAEDWGAEDWGAEDWGAEDWGAEDWGAEDWGAEDAGS